MSDEHQTDCFTLQRPLLLMPRVPCQYVQQFSCTLSRRLSRRIRNNASLIPPSRTILYSRPCRLRSSQVYESATTISSSPDPKQRHETHLSVVHIPIQIGRASCRERVYGECSSDVCSSDLFRLYTFPSASSSSSVSSACDISCLPSILSFSATVHNSISTQRAQRNERDAQAIASSILVIS